MNANIKQISSTSDAERQIRIDLAAAHRMAYRLGWNDGIFNHFTHTIPGRTGRFLVKPHGVLMSEVSASNLIVVDGDGNTLEGEGFVETTALNIHAAIHELVPSASCILHIHPPYAMWLTCLQDNRLKMINQTCLRFFNNIAYDDEYAGLAVARDEGERMANAIGNHSIIMHVNHGVTSVGADVAHAFYELFYLEKACTEYYRVVSCGLTPRIIGDEIAAKAAGQLGAEYEASTQLLFGALKRGLDRDEPEYAH